MDREAIIAGCLEQAENARVQAAKLENKAAELRELADAWEAFSDDIDDMVTTYYPTEE